MSARVIAGFGTSSGYDAYTIERAGPPPNVIQRSHGAVAVVHGAAARAATNVLGPGFVPAPPLSGCSETEQDKSNIESHGNEMREATGCPDSYLMMELDPLWGERPPEAEAQKP